MAASSARINLPVITGGGICANVGRVKAIRRFTVRTVLPESIAPLARLAGNLRWSWHRPTQQLFEQLDPKAWVEVGQDPVALLGSFTRERLRELAADQHVVTRVSEIGRASCRERVL